MGPFISIPPPIFGPFISTPGIFISNFPFLPFGTLTPTVTSGISRVFLFKIIGAFTSALKICLIFNGTFPSIAPLIPPGISTQEYQHRI